LLAFLGGRLKAAQQEPEFSVEEEVDLPLGDEGLLGAAPQLLPVSGDEERDVDVGDLVTYCDLAEPDRRLIVRIVEGVSNKEAGEVNENTPLAKVLLGLEVGGQEELVVPPYSKRVLQVLKIERPKPHRR